MTAVASNSNGIEATASRMAEKTAAAGTRSWRILAVVDGSERTGRVVKYLLELGLNRGPIEVVLLNIQPRPQEWRLRGYGWFHREAIHDRLINDLGERIVRSASRHLKAAAIAYRSRIEIGEIIETTVRCAREEDCDLLVLAERPSGVVRRWLMSAFGLTIGSISSIAVHFVRSPVIAIK
jgi:nucleotide-binding universal stress UspA family protein